MSPWTFQVGLNVTVDETWVDVTSRHRLIHLALHSESGEMLGGESFFQLMSSGGKKEQVSEKRGKMQRRMKKEERQKGSLPSKSRCRGVGWGVSFRTKPSSPWSSFL